MKITLAKFSAAMLVLGIAVGCSQQNTPVAGNDAAPPIQPIEAERVDTAPSVPGIVTLTEYDTSVLPVEGGNCALDAINGGPVAGATVKVNSETMFGGWIADAANQVPTEARLVFKGTEKSYSAPLVAGVERQDVAAALSAETLRLSGYAVLAKLELLPDTYKLSIAHGIAGSEASCPLNASLIVTD